MSKPKSKEDVSKLQSLLEFAVHLTQYISNAPDLINESSSPFQDSDLYFAALPLKRNELSLDERIELDQKGVQLWNACCRIDREESKDEKIRVYTAKARAFAWLLVDSAVKEKGKNGNVEKIFRYASRAVKDCLAIDDLQLAEKIVERLAEGQTLSQDPSDLHGEDNVGTSRISNKLLMLRLLLAWKRERLDLADHFYTLLADQMSNLEDSIKIDFADLLYEIGSQLLKDGHHELATKWLSRACSLVEEQLNTCLFAESQDLRLNILHTYVRALLAKNDAQAIAQAANVMNTLERDFGHKLAVTLLKIDRLTRNPKPNIDSYYDEVLKVIRTVHLIDANHKIIMHHIHHLKTLNLKHALKALKQYIIQRLAPDEDTRHTENAVVTFIWMAITDAATDAQPADIDADLSLFRQIWSRSLSAEAAHAVFLLLWKRIEKADQLSSHALISWCQVAFNPLLENAGQSNAGKLQRKVIIHHMKEPDLEAASACLSNMSEQVKQHPLSLYLAYSVTLRCRNENQAEAVLAAIVKIPDKDNKLLLACVGETMKYGNQRQSAILLHRVLDKFNYDLPPAVDACALLRCTARLLMSVLAEDQSPDSEMLARLCSIFRAATSLSSKCNGDIGRSKTSFTLQECQWFSRNSYNVALEHVESWPANTVIDLMEYSCQIKYPQGVIPQEVIEARMKLYTNAIFVQGILYITEARRCDSSWTIEDLPKTSYNFKEHPASDTLRFPLYQKAAAKYDLLRQMFEASQADGVEPTANEDNDLKSKLNTLLPLTFESILYMDSQNVIRGSFVPFAGLAALIDEATGLNAPAKTFAVFADLILTSAMTAPSANEDMQMSSLPLSTAVQLLTKVVNAIRNQNDYDVTRAARWIRCVVQMVLDHRSDDRSRTDATEQGDSLLIVASVVEEALNLARDASKVAQAREGGMDVQCYPSDELQWLATTLFNLAVDYFVAENQGEAKRWSGLAVDVADALGRNGRESGGDNGKLATVLRGRVGRMRVVD